MTVGVERERRLEDVEQKRGQTDPEEVEAVRRATLPEKHEQADREIDDRDEREIQVLAACGWCRLDRLYVALPHAERIAVGGNALDLVDERPADAGIVEVVADVVDAVNLLPRAVVVDEPQELSRPYSRVEGGTARPDVESFNTLRNVDPDHAVVRDGRLAELLPHVHGGERDRADCQRNHKERSHRCSRELHRPYPFRVRNPRYRFSCAPQWRGASRQNSAVYNLQAAFHHRPM